MPAHQASAWITSVPEDPPVACAPSVRSRTAVMTAETGWCSAKPCSQVGMELTGTNADDAKTSGASTGNAAACDVSGSPTARPTRANTQDIAYEKSSTSRSPAITSNMDVCTRNPT